VTGEDTILFFTGTGYDIHQRKRR